MKEEDYTTIKSSSVSIPKDKVLVETKTEERDGEITVTFILRNRLRIQRNGKQYVETNKHTGVYANIYTESMFQSDIPIPQFGAGIVPMQEEEVTTEKKHIAVLCETKEPTRTYLSKLNGELVSLREGASVPDTRYYVPMAKAQPGKLVVVVQKDILQGAISEMDKQLACCACIGHTADCAWVALVELLTGEKK